MEAGVNVVAVVTKAVEKRLVLELPLSETE